MICKKEKNSSYDFRKKAWSGSLATDFLLSAAAQFLSALSLHSVILLAHTRQKKT
jgi:hypothetical protein